AVLRDVLGNPFHLSLPVAPVLRKGNGHMSLHLAQAAYDDRRLPSGNLDPGRLGVFADALEEAGCTDTALLGHLRSPGPHVRGCYALDALLGNPEPEAGCGREGLGRIPKPVEDAGLALEEPQAPGTEGPALRGCGVPPPLAPVDRREVPAGGRGR